MIEKKQKGRGRDYRGRGTIGMAISSWKEKKSISGQGGRGGNGARRGKLGFGRKKGRSVITWYH